MSKTKTPPLPSSGGSYELVNNKLRQTEAPTADDPGKSARAAAARKNTPAVPNTNAPTGQE